MDPKILAEQKVLKDAGFYGGRLDGDDGPHTRAARAAFAASQTPADSAWVADPRSEGNLATLHPGVQPLAREFLRQCRAAGFRFKITSGLRTFEEQDALYAKGRTAGGEIVTKARGGHSSHNFALAFDVTMFAANETTPVWDGIEYTVAAPLGKMLGLEWGGDWKSLNDKPHYQLRPAWAVGMSESAMLAGLRQRKKDGEDFLA
jgi:peptidoglycan LD-endopeptidase CwlK